MTQDAESAWRYLHAFRDVADQNIILYGVGVGASLATHLAVSHPGSLGVILESPQADLLETVRHDRRVRILPVGLLFHDDFPLAGTLSILHTSKLLLSVGAAPSVFQEAADPKITVEFQPDLGPFYTQPSFSQAVSRFLDQSLPPPPPPRLVLTPRTTAAPPRLAK
jgi:pimeloyl-ACP methyl ester carboxylesterase